MANQQRHENKIGELDKRIYMCVLRRNTSTGTAHHFCCPSAALVAAAVDFSEDFSFLFFFSTWHCCLASSFMKSACVCHGKDR